MIVPQKQEFSGPRDGDCFRTAVAVAMGVPRSWIPVTGCDVREKGGMDVVLDQMNEFLSPMQLRILTLSWGKDDVSFRQIVRLTKEKGAWGIPLVVVGKAKGCECNHAVTVCEGKVADPACGEFVSYRETFDGPSIPESQWLVHAVVRTAFPCLPVLKEKP